MQETEKIWMNGELVDWADAKVHVGATASTTARGVFEGIRCYDTPKGPAVFRLTTTWSASSTRRRCSTWTFRTPSRSSGRDPRADRGQRPRVVLRRPMAFYGYGELGVGTTGNPVDVVIMSFPWGAYLGEEGSARASRRRSRPGSGSART